MHFVTNASREFVLYQYTYGHGCEDAAVFVLLFSTLKNFGHDHVVVATVVGVTYFHGSRLVICFGILI